MKHKDEFKWEQPQLQQHNVVRSGDLRIVDLPVQCLFEWSDKIVADYDEESGYIEYTSGYVMTVMPNQKFVYKDHKTTFVAQAMLNTK
jgi:hypothetical protein